jgi:hypothetical protein
MFVIVNKPKAKKSKIKDLCPGDVFMSSDEFVYLRTTAIKSGELSYNAVLLCNGEFFCFGDEIKVTPLTPHGRISFNEIMINE